MSNNTEVKNAIESMKTKRSKKKSNARAVFGSFLMFVIVFSAFVFSVLMSFSITKDKTINYSEKSDIDYKVYLKENDFYDTPYLDKGMAYVASLIDKITIKYNYIFDVNEKSDIDVQYQIIGKLVIASQNNANVFYEKEYDLTDLNKDSISSQNYYSLMKEVNIDYTYYNNLANKFRSNYAVNTTSYLEVYLSVSENSRETNSYKLNNQSRTTLTIPLSEQEINVKLNNQNVNEKKQIVSKGGIVVKNEKMKIASIPLLMATLIMFVLFIRNIMRASMGKISEYDRFINRILRGYDRIIVTVKTAPKTENYNVIKVANIDELIDVRDNVKEPINYYVIKEHERCAFFVIHNEDLYLYAVQNSGEDKHEKR